MADVWFYHLERRSVDQELPGLLQKGLERGLRMLVVAPDEARVRSLSNAIWAFEDVAFLPHGIAGEADAERAPIVLAHAGNDGVSADFLLCIDGHEPPDVVSFARTSIMFNGNTEAAVTQARVQWKRFKAEGHHLRYWKQDEDGRWRDQAAQ